MKKAKYILTMCLGDTDLDIHGSADQVEEIYISETDCEISEMIHALNWEEFISIFKENLYYLGTR
jgi:hypothetical protein